MCLAAARRQPRGVFTVTDMRYDDGRRNLHMPLKEQFRLTAAAYNDVVFDRGLKCRALCSDVFARSSRVRPRVPRPPVRSPARRQRLHQAVPLPGRPVRLLARSEDHGGDGHQEAGEAVHTVRIKRTIGKALADIFNLFRESIIVLSYNSQSIPDQVEITRLLRRVKKHVHCIAVPHRYHFGTHSRGSSAPGERVHLRRSVGRWQSSPSRSDAISPYFLVAFGSLVLA